MVVIDVGGGVEGHALKEWQRCRSSPVKSVLDGHHRIPESLSAFWRIVSFTAANTRRIFEVSVACVRLDSR